MKTFAEIITWIFVIGLLILVVPTIFEIVCAVVIAVIYACVYLLILAFVLDILGVKTPSSFDDHKTWNYA